MDPDRVWMETDEALSPCWAGRGAQAAQDPPRGPGGEEGAGTHCHTVCPFASCCCRFPVFPLEECKCHRRAAAHSTPKLVFPIGGQERLTGPAGLLLRPGVSTAPGRGLGPGCA